MGPFPYLIGSDFIAVTIGSKVHNIDGSNANFGALKSAIKAKNWDLVSKTIDLASAIRTWAKGAVTVTESAVFYNGEALSNGLTQHILSMIRDGFDATPMVKFLEKLMENPSFNSRASLYRFVDANKITIHPDGDMILYKNVNRAKSSKFLPGDLVDIHSGTIRNNVGDKPSMNRSAVDDNVNNLCSYGLHVCSLAYLKSFTGDVTVLVKVNPKDVIAVPVDYNDTKMRVASYEVIGIHEKGYETEFTDKAVYDPEPDIYPEEETWEPSEEFYEDDYQRGFDDGYAARDEAY